MKVELIRWNEAFRKDLIEICNQVDRSFLTNRMPYPYTKEDADWWLHMVSEHDGKDGIFRAIRVDGKIVGNITVEQKTDVYCKDAEIGYFLINTFWAKGIASKSVKEICKFAFQELDVVRITGLVYAQNKASARVLEKNGFVLEGIQNKAVYKNGELHDLCLFGKLI